MTDPAPTDGQPLPPAAGASQPPAVVPAPPQDVPEAPPLKLWDRMREDPQYAPEHLALEAVRRLGPEAAQWAARARAEQPGASVEVLAEQAVRKFVNHARLSGAVSGAAGLPGAVIDVGVLAWTQARMVLHVAAAYGVDPTHADRATDLLVLQKVHKVAESARLALGVAAGRERAGALFGSGGQNPLGKVMLRLGVRLAQMAGVRAAKRVFAKVVPGAAIILGTWANSSATKDLAGRSRALYRQHGNPGVPEPRRP
ncbi:EcsC family protein [Micromonospora sp. NPDC004336]